MRGRIVECYFELAGASGLGGAARVRLISSNPKIAAQKASSKPSMNDSTLASRLTTEPIIAVARATVVAVSALYPTK